jgi:hypothetical protein
VAAPVRHMTRRHRQTPCAGLCRHQWRPRQRRTCCKLTNRPSKTRRFGSSVRALQSSQETRLERHQERLKWQQSGSGRNLRKKYAIGKPSQNHCKHWSK